MTFSEGRTIRGVTIIGNELYVLRMPANNEIEVYNVDEVKLESAICPCHVYATPST